MTDQGTVTIDMLCVRFTALRADDLHRWIGQAWVRPDRTADNYIFRDIDVERVRLILELRDEMQVNEDALPVVLSLLDQLYDMRRRMRRLRDALDLTVSDDTLRDLIRRLGNTDPAAGGDAGLGKA
jgi:chaperone modulatory protein CbpM